MASKSTVYFESGHGKYVKTYKTRPEWVSVFLKRDALVNKGIKAREKGDTETLRKVTRSICTIKRKIEKEGIFCEFVCHGKLNV